MKKVLKINYYQHFVNKQHWQNVKVKNAFITKIKSITLFTFETSRRGPDEMRTVIIPRQQPQWSGATNVQIIYQAEFNGAFRVWLKGWQELADHPPHQPLPFTLSAVGQRFHMVISLTTSLYGIKPHYGCTISTERSPFYFLSMFFVFFANDLLRRPFPHSSVTRMSAAE